MASPELGPSFYSGIATEYDMEDIEYREAQRSLDIILVPKHPLQISRSRQTAALGDITDCETACETRSWPLRIFLWTSFVALLVMSFSFYVNGRCDPESVLEAMKTALGKVFMTGILMSTVLFL